jgi:membrane-associated protein
MSLAMDSIITFAFERVEIAHWIFFVLIMLAGLNVPVSEDAIMVCAGAITSAYIPEKTLWIFGWLFMACWISAWEAYWIGRLLGPKLYNMKWFSWIISREKIHRLHYYYEKFGVLTFLIGRFIPGGVRNVLFMSSGLGKMPFYKFILRDLLGCFLSTLLLFYIGYAFGQNVYTVIAYFKSLDRIALLIIIGFLLVILAVACYRPRKGVLKPATE